MCSWVVFSGLIYSVDSCVCFRRDIFFFFNAAGTADPSPRGRSALWTPANAARTPWQVSPAQVGEWGRRHAAGRSRGARSPRRRLAGFVQPASEPRRRGSAAVPFASARGSQRAPPSGWVWGRREAAGRARRASVPAGWRSSRGRGRRARLGRGT